MLLLAADARASACANSSRIAPRRPSATTKSFWEALRSAVSAAHCRERAACASSASRYDRKTLSSAPVPLRYAAEASGATVRATGGASALAKTVECNCSSLAAKASPKSRPVAATSSRPTSSSTAATYASVRPRRFLRCSTSSSRASLARSAPLSLALVSVCSFARSCAASAGRCARSTAN